MPNMDYSLIQRTPDGTGMFLVTTPGSPDKGSYVLEADMKIYTNQGMVAIADIVDDLVTADATKPLSANQGVVLKQLIDAFSGGIVPKGDILSTNLPAADASNKGWQYYCTDTNQWATSDGTQWIMTSNNVITQTPDATDTGHALSNAVVTQCCNEVKARLNQHESRLENLEQVAGDYTTVQYRGTNAVPTGKAKYGLVKTFVGKSRAWNQLVNKTVFPQSQTINGVTFTNNGDGSITVNGTATELTTYELYPDNANNGLNPIIGHKYLMKGCPTGGDSSLFRLYQNNNGAFGSSLNDFGNGVISPVATNSNSNALRIQVQEGVTVNNKTFFPTFYDLTLIFGAGNEPSTVSDALAQLPALGQYNAYDAGSLVDTEVSGVKSVGVNIWDEQPQIGGLWSDGTENNNVTNALRSNYIPVLRSTSYYIKSTNGYAVYVRFYDVNKKSIGSTWNYPNIKNTSFTTSADTVYIRFILLSDYGATYNHDIQICLNSYADKTTYHPYMTDTLSLSETVTLRSAGSVADELDVETGEVTHPLKTVFMKNIGYEYNATLAARGVFPFRLTDWKPAGELISAKYLHKRTTNWQEDDMTIITVSSGTYLRICNQRCTTVEALIAELGDDELIYELATPDPSTFIDPVPYNFIEVQGDGTIETIQEQTPVIDNCLDVGYLTV